MTETNCACGCGEKVKIYNLNNSTRGLKKGTPNKFIHGHNKANLGNKHSQESKIKMKKARKKYCDSIRGKTYEEIYGKEKSIEIKEKISKKRVAPKGINSPLFGKDNKWGKHTADAIRKISESSKNRKFSLEVKKLRSKAMKERRKTITFLKKDTSIELKIQNFLKDLGITFFTHHYIKDIIYGYQCDILIPVQPGISQKTIIECDGDYWHGNLNIFNYNKLSKRIKWNRILDFERNAQLEEAGYKVIRLWGSCIKSMKLDAIRQYFSGGKNLSPK